MLLHAHLLNTRKVVHRLASCVLPGEFTDKLCKNKFVCAINEHKVM